MKAILSKTMAGLGLFALLAMPARSADRHSLATQVPAGAAHSPVLSRLPAATRLRLTIGLPFRNQEILTNLVQQLYDRHSTNFHRFLRPDQFAAQFGPTEPDYQRVKDYAASNRLEVVGTSGNRAVLDVSGSVADIERTFQTRLGFHQHPTEPRQYFGPDTPPSVDPALPILYVSGLDNYSLPHPQARKLAPATVNGQTNADGTYTVGTGSGTNGYYLGRDFRTAYVPGVPLAGTGQVVGLVEYDGYNTSDILKYEALANISDVTLTNILVAGVTNSAPGPDDNGNFEVALDIEMVIAMAPGMSKLEVVEGAIVNGSIPDTTIVDVMNAFADQTNPSLFANQISSSWGASSDTNQDQQLMEMAAQGQSFFYASGDNGAPAGGTNNNTDDFNYVTSVGATELYMTGAGTNWQAEQVWDNQSIEGESAGYIMTALPIPDYQKEINLSAVGGSTQFRNCPDVSMAGDNIEVVYTQVNTNDVTVQTGKIIEVAGTSAAAPLWAGFTALVNEQAVSEGKPTVGFLNPALYAIGLGSGYTNCFHDITVGNDTNTNSAGLFFAARGYDLCTGWGSPNGAGLINALVGYTGPIFVDFGYNGPNPNGSYATPYQTLAQGTNAVRNGGTIFLLNGGSSAPTPKISKPMTITAQGGTAIIVN